MTDPATQTHRAPLLPLWLKVAFTAFMVVLVPVYWSEYGPLNFLYFCDIALFLTLAGLWTESALLISMAAAGIILPQALWCVDFRVEMTGNTFTTMTSYMFNKDRSLFLRGLSFFHGWLPFLLWFAVRRTGYDRRGAGAWTLTAWGLCLICWFFVAPPGTHPEGSGIPQNVNYVYGMSETASQTIMPAPLYLIVWMASLAAVVYLPTHYLLRRVMPAAKSGDQNPG